MISTILFDCDNTLVLSEPLAFASCAQVSNAILDAYASEATSHRYTGPELQAQYVGKNFRALIEALEQRHGFTVPVDEVDRWVGMELETTMKNIRAGATPCEGVGEELERLSAAAKGYRLAVVSSSALPRVLASLSTTSLDKYFTHVFSAASMTPPTSKPDPAVYLHACRELGVDPRECVAVEDSRSGATAAVRAGIPLIGYVGPYYEEGRAEADRMDGVLKECGAKVVTHHWRDFQACLDMLGAMMDIAVQ